MTQHLTSSAIESLLREALEMALKKGANEADALYVQGTSLSLACRDQKMEELERSEGNDLGLRVFVGNRQAVVSTSEFSKPSLSNLIDRALSMARAVPEDPFCGLALKQDLTPSYGNYDSYDMCEDKEDVLFKEAQACEEAALSVENGLKSEGVETSWGKSLITLATSRGFLGTYQESHRTLSVSIIAEKKGKMERDYDSTTGIYREDMIPAETLGRNAAKRALKRLFPQKIASTKIPIVFDPRVGSSLLEHLASAINGASIARGTSFLKDKLETSLFSKEVTILDNPHILRGLRSRPFDAEGIETRPLSVVEAGVLKTWILDLRSARQLNLKTTGHAIRSTGGIPHPAVSNFFMKPGSLAPQDLLKNISRGFYVTELIGFGLNLVTGDYSRGASGFMIENGELTYPISEVTIAGNLLDMFAKVTPCSDLKLSYGIDVPTLMIEGMTIAGS